MFDLIVRGANLPDGRVVAINRDSGEIVWDKQVAKPDEFGSKERFRSAPIAAEGKIIVANGSGDAGTRGWLAGLDAIRATQARGAYEYLREACHFLTVESHLPDGLPDAPFRRREHDDGGVAELIGLLVVLVGKADGLGEGVDNRRGLARAGEVRQVRSNQSAFALDDMAAAALPRSRQRCSDQSSCRPKRTPA